MFWIGKVKMIIEELQGWRKSSGEELQVIQGLLLDLAKGRMHTEKMSGVVSGTGFFFCIAIIYEMCSFLPQMFQMGDISFILAMLVAAVMVLFFTWNFGLAFYEVFFRNTYKIFCEKVKKGEFRVLDVEIAEGLKMHNVRGNADHHYVKVKDMNGNIWDESVELKYVKNYQKGQAVLIVVELAGLTDSKTKKTVTKSVVIPCKQESADTWEKGLKLYHKYMSSKKTKA